MNRGSTRKSAYRPSDLKKNIQRKDNLCFGFRENFISKFGKNSEINF